MAGALRAGSIGGGRPMVDGKFLRVNGSRIFIKAVTYGSFAANSAGEPFPEMRQLREDFARMREAGINAVRLYSAPSDRIADAASDANLYLIPDIAWGPRTCEWDYPDWWQKAVDATRADARRLGSHPAVLMLSIGNEIPPLVVRWYGRQKTQERLRILYETVKEEAAESIVTYVNHPPTEHLGLSFLDVVSFNIYLDREADFRAYLGRLQTLAGDRPLFLSELGLDSREHGEAAQAEYLDWQLRAVFEKGLCGAAVYSWTDEWSIFRSNITGWSFGLTTIDRKPKKALSTVRDIFHSNFAGLRRSLWPMVSVVVAAYNAESTLHDCLSWLARLNYPRYEVIVIDDGSADRTPEIVRQHGVRAVHVPNGGLSRARNLGIEMAKGSIVAFVDSDAHPDINWLFYLVWSLEEQNAAGVGGPNILPDGAGFTEACVDCAPGNPTHVLLDDERAEHLPGCNMAYRKDALLEIGMFDVTHRAAGDDVDVCWKLLARGRTLAFSPSAIVYHHRRRTVSAYLRQQRGYGFAEAHLQRRYPGRFNFFGHQVWRGSIYDTVHHGLREHGFPLLFAPKIYQGNFCSAQFQSVYQPFLTWWFQIFTVLEWQGLTVGVLASGILGLSFGGVGAVFVLALGVAMLLLGVASALLCAMHSSRRKPWRDAARVKGVLLVALLHWLQPLARAWGRVRGWWAERGEARTFPSSQRMYGNLCQREQLLRGLPQHLRACGWVSQPASEWSEMDLEVVGPGPYRIFVTTVYEDDVAHTCHYVRYRITAQMKPLAPVMTLLTLALLFGVVLQPWLLPLAVPVGLLLFKFLTARRTMTKAISQLVAENAEAVGMVPAKNDF
jgi:cellulose synthase/poly-beta-1,6-N-acetylglucosamine synthase-like glycosyltransferase